VICSQTSPLATLRRNRQQKRPVQHLQPYIVKICHLDQSLGFMKIRNEYEITDIPSIFPSKLRLRSSANITYQILRLGKIFLNYSQVSYNLMKLYIFFHTALHFTTKYRALLWITVQLIGVGLFRLRFRQIKALRFLCYADLDFWNAAVNL